MALGFLVAGLPWIGLAVRPSVPMVVVAFAVLALGEMMYAARYYEYVSRLAPSGQQGLYMGYAFLPIGIGYFIAGPLGGYLVHRSESGRAENVWWVITAVGVLTVLLLWVYDRVVKPSAQEATQ